MTEQVGEQPDDPAMRAAVLIDREVTGLVIAHRERVATIIREEYAPLVAEAERLKRIVGGTHVLARDLNIAKRELDTLRGANARLEGEATKPIPMVLCCPQCTARHIDEGEFETKPHHTHACQVCGFVWRPAIVATVGVRFLPGFKNENEQQEQQDGELQSRPERSGEQRALISPDTKGQPRADEASRPLCSNGRIRKVVLELNECTGRVSCTFITCCVSWQEMKDAVVKFRDKLNSEIDRQSLCPFYKPEDSPPVAQPSEPEPEGFACGAIHPEKRYVCVLRRDGHDNHIANGITWRSSSPPDRVRVASPTNEPFQSNACLNAEPEPPECPCCLDGCRDPHNYQGSEVCQKHRVPLCYRVHRDRALKKIEEARAKYEESEQRAKWREQQIADAKDDVLPCGHHPSLLVRSVESSATWCALCEVRSRLRDAVAMEDHYKKLAATPRFVVTPEMRESVVRYVRDELFDADGNVLDWDACVEHADGVLTILGATVSALPAKPCGIPLGEPSALHSELSEAGELDEHVRQRHPECSAENGAEGR